MSKEKYRYIFCILTFRNANDLAECLESINKNVEDYKCVIVNSFYDEKSKVDISRTASQYNCDFLNVDNKGYGHGNNCGIRFINEKYEYDYIIISNPDIIIDKFQPENLPQNAIIAPLITTIKGKSQNPYWIKENLFTEKLIYKGMKRHKKLPLIAGIGINKVARELSLFRFKRSNKTSIQIYAAHGSFCMLPNKFVQKVGVPYDENMFLFSEEAYLAYSAQKCGIKTYLTKEINITHKEDGSMKLSSADEGSEESKSFVYYYETYRES